MSGSGDRKGKETSVKPEEDNSKGMAPEQEEPRAEIDSLLAEPAAAKQMLEKLSEENRILTESIARARADFFNYRKRVERENERLRSTASENAAAALLPVLDNLDRALASNKRDEDPFYKGVEMVRVQFFSVLESMGVSAIDTVGSPFDPALHEAVATVEAGEGFEEGTITEEIQAGYTIAGKVLRAARVKVARAVS